MFGLWWQFELLPLQSLLSHCLCFSQNTLYTEYFKYFYFAYARQLYCFSGHGLAPTCLLTSFLIQRLAKLHLAFLSLLSPNVMPKFYFMIIICTWCFSPASPSFFFLGIQKLKNWSGSPWGHQNKSVFFFCYTYEFCCITSFWAIVVMRT